MWLWSIFLCKFFASRILSWNLENMRTPSPETWHGCKRLNWTCTIKKWKSVFFLSLFKWLGEQESFNRLVIRMWCEHQSIPNCAYASKNIALWPLLMKRLQLKIALMPTSIVLHWYFFSRICNQFSIKVQSQNERETQRIR